MLKKFLFLRVLVLLDFVLGLSIIFKVFLTHHILDLESFEIFETYLISEKNQESE